MKIVIICQYFPPEPAPVGVMMRELGEDLAAAGHAVTIITGFPNHPSGEVYTGYRRRLFSAERRGPLRIIRCYLHTSPRKSFRHRLCNYLTFAATSLLAAVTLQRQDVLFIPSPPLTNGVIALVLKMLTGTPYVYNVQDIFPDAAIAAGVLKHRGLIALAMKLEMIIYRGAARISVISEGFRSNLIAKGVPQPKIEVIYNWLDTGEIVPMPRNNDFARRHQLVGKFVVLYSGTIGLISGAEILIDCAVRLARYPDILFLFVGEGVSKDAIMAQAHERGISNMMFLPFQSRDLLSNVQSSSDVSVVTLKPGMGRTSVPSKVLGYMAAARPVLASVDHDSDTRSFIERADCGLCVAPGDAAALSDAILALYRDRERCRRLGANGRAFLQQFCERRAITRRYERLLSAVERGSP